MVYADMRVFQEPFEDPRTRFEGAKSLPPIAKAPHVSLVLFFWGA